MEIPMNVTIIHVSQRFELLRTGAVAVAGTCLRCPLAVHRGPAAVHCVKTRVHPMNNSSQVGSTNDPQTGWDGMVFVRENPIEFHG